MRTQVFLFLRRMRCPLRHAAIKASFLITNLMQSTLTQGFVPQHYIRAYEVILPHTHTCQCHWREDAAAKWSETLHFPGFETALEINFTGIEYLRLQVLSRRSKLSQTKIKNKESVPLSHSFFLLERLKILFAQPQLQKSGAVDIATTSGTEDAGSNPARV
jgi:hypothetical protein